MRPYIGGLSLGCACVSQMRQHIMVTYILSTATSMLPAPWEIRVHMQFVDTQQNAVNLHSGPAFTDQGTTPMECWSGLVFTSVLCAVNGRMLVQNGKWCWEWQMVWSHTHGQQACCYVQAAYTVDVAILVHNGAVHLVWHHTICHFGQPFQNQPHDAEHVKVHYTHHYTYVRTCHMSCMTHSKITSPCNLNR